MLNIHFVGFCGFDDTINDSGGSCAIDSVGEQPVLTADHKGTDRVLRPVVGQGNMREAKKADHKQKVEEKHAGIKAGFDGFKAKLQKV